ncbi:four helix bundle protein [Neolewinella xylanilytica]|uniref:Four helix bundle protein n=1 Tax=Neolewinella xylanilytica TaxID=1514080 RepID=A0A2S6I9K7_9BACT|nr:four helix bundle protein [Neolewinella xylanilytica]PPK88149.1 four helix bundle protein [Neolewinella xylanilytica]
MTSNERAAELEERLIAYSVRIVKLAEKFPRSYAGKHFGHQLLRSGTAPALLYGEARGAESNKDFRHKISIGLKELRESHISLRIVDRSDLVSKIRLNELIEETNELISIFVATVRTLDQRQKKTNH